MINEASQAVRRSGDVEQSRRCRWAGPRIGKHSRLRCGQREPRRFGPSAPPGGGFNWTCKAVAQRYLLRRRSIRVRRPPAVDAWKLLGYRAFGRSPVSHQRPRQGDHGFCVNRRRSSLTSTVELPVGIVPRFLFDPSRRNRFGISATIRYVAIWYPATRVPINARRILSGAAPTTLTTTSE